jgi:hypothetical protein
MNDSEIAAHEAVALAPRRYRSSRRPPKEAARRPPASRHASSIDFPTQLR